jgi:hypothetical protein
MELGWATDKDIQPFLSQPTLVSDYLSDYLDLIHNANTEEEKHAIIWSVCNLVPLRQFGPGELKIVFYENLCTQPEIELAAIFASAGQNYEIPNNEAVSRPSQTTRSSSAVVEGTDKISSWPKKLSVGQTRSILRIVQAFGLDQIYGDSLLPLSKDAI